MKRQLLGIALKSAIKSAGMGPAEFARAMGELPQTVNSWISRNGVPPAKAELAASILGVNAPSISPIKTAVTPIRGRLPAENNSDKIAELMASVEDFTPSELSELSLAIQSVLNQRLRAEK